MRFRLRTLLILALLCCLTAPFWQDAWPIVRNRITPVGSRYVQQPEKDQLGNFPYVSSRK